MVVQEANLKDLQGYMLAHGCPSLLISPLIQAHSTVHWRDLEGHWFTVKYDEALSQFEATES